ncbi:MAG: serine/threonine protein kinase [SAR324 cluster bacterium]|nr:serine/threonine protein kinase [SAR324 cluster bacterium]
MHKFRQPPKEYSKVFLEDTDRPLPDVINQNTRYMFLATIAKGGKSLIKSCKDLHLNRVVAYKTLRPEFVDDEIEKKRLLREARISAMLQHPNTIPTYEIGRDNRGNYYFTMKLVHGYTLREIMDYRERYDLSQLIEVIDQISHVLASAHAHGVVHRDIKPENILVGRFNEVLLLDWGLAKVWRKDGSTTDDDTHESEAVVHSEESMTGRGKLQGTLCYMSPEQIRRDPNIDFSTDIYSLGSVLYELLTGKLPFDSDMTYEILDMVENQEPAKPSEVTKYKVPKALEKLCLQCLHKEPAARPASMDEILRTLQQNWLQEL